MDKINKIEQEKLTLSLMIDMYCTKLHKSKLVLCQDCQAIKKYAFTKLEKCPFGLEKPTCLSCEIHCYSPEKREQIRQIMRFSGPRMLFRNPILVFRHFIKK